ncbi:MAG: P-II family nitrogen regulator [Actinobacteria bacterium]|nr:P-II family nitrogen regulator [Actinomycetota bacterium]
MKLVIAIIKPLKLEVVKDELRSLGVKGITVTEVKGYGRQEGHVEIYRGAEYRVEFVPKVKLEIAVPDELADQVVERIMLAARTGQIGDGKVFVLPLEGAYRIRTGEGGETAL